MPTPTGRLTRAQIIQQAQRRAGNTSTSLFAEMRTWLNLEIEDLYTQWDWPFLMTTVQLALGGVTFPLPTDFLRSQDDDALQITAIDGIAQRYRRIPEVDLGRYWARYDPDTTSNIPLLWAADRANDVGRLWPLPTAAVSAQLRYKKTAGFIDPALFAPVYSTYDDDVPIFPWHSYLVEQMYARVLEWDENPLALQALGKAAAMLEKIRAVALPQHSISPTLDLDPDTFIRPFSPEGE